MIRFCEEAGIPIRGMISAGTLEGGDVMILEPGLAVIGAGDARTQEAAARQLAGWLTDDGWEVRVEPISARWVHIDVLIGLVAERLVAAAVDALSYGFVRWLRERGFELIELEPEHAFTLGANAISLGEGRVISAARAKPLNDALRAHGVEVVDPDLEMFTLGGGGAHCLGHALRREQVGR